MSPLDYLSADFCTRLVTTMLHFLWQATAITILVILIDRMLRKASATLRYGLFLAAFLTMALCPLATFPLTSSPVRETSPVLPQPVAIAHVEDMPQLAPSAARPVPSALPVSAFPTLLPRPAVADAPPPVPQPQPQPQLDHWKSLAPVVTGLYLLGVSLLLVRLVAGLHGGRRLRLASQNVTDTALLAMLAARAKAIGLRAVPAVALCSRLAVPVVVGVLRPMVLLPLTLASGLSPQQLEAILTHELAHIRRFDPLVNLLQRLIEAFLFFHPAVWYVSRRIRVERENCCDDLAVAAGAESLAYAQSLLHLAQHSLAGRAHRRSAAAALAAADKPSQLRSRISRLLGSKQEETRLVRTWPAAMLLLVAAGVVIAAASTGSSQSKLIDAPTTQPILDEEAWFKRCCDYLRNRLSDKDASIRADAAEKLGSSDDNRAAMDDLKKALSDPVPAVRYSAAVSLAKLGYVDDRVAVALGECFIGGPTRSMHNGSDAGDVYHVFHVGDIGSKAKAAIPLFIRAAKPGTSSQWQWRSYALTILGKIGVPEVIPTLLEALHDSDNNLRCTAVRALASIGPAAKDAVPDLTEALGGRDFCAKLAGEALAKIGAVDVLIEELKKRDPNRHEPAVLGLAYAKDNLNEVVHVLTAEIERGDWQAGESLIALGEVARPAMPAFLKLARRQGELAWASRAVVAARFAAKFGWSEQFLPIFTEQFISGSPHESSNAAEALAELGPAATAATKPLLKVLTSPKNPSARGSGDDARIYAARALGRIKPDDPNVIAALVLALDDPGLRESAELSLAEYGQAAAPAVPRLIELMHHVQGEVINGRGSDAIKTLGAIGPGARGAVPALIKGIKERHFEDDARAAMIKIGEEAVPYLLEEFQETPAEQRFAAECLAQMDSLGKSMLPTLLAMLEHEDQGVRISAMRALGKMGSNAGEALGPLRKSLGDPDSLVQFEAATALRKIRKSMMAPTQPGTSTTSSPVAPAAQSQPFLQALTGDPVEVELTAAQERRVRELVYILRNCLIDSRADQWASAIQELVLIGKGAAPELAAELDRTDRDPAMRTLTFALRAIGDPRSVPALIRALRKSPMLKSDYGIAIADPRLHAFMGSHGIGAADNYPSFTVARAVREVATALERITGHSEGKDYLAEPADDSPSEMARIRKLREQAADRWQTWWQDNRPRFAMSPQAQASEQGDVVGDAGRVKFGAMFPTGASVKLGTIQEMLLPPGDSAEAKAFLDLDSGRVLPLYEGFQPTGSSYDAWRWMTRVGIDAKVQTVRVDNKSFYMLHGVDTYAWQVDNGRWETLDTELQGKGVSVGPPDSTGFVPRGWLTGEIKELERLLPATFLFTTTGGHCGILQVLESSDKPQEGIRLRYRLVEGGPARAPSTSTAAASRP